MTSITPKSVLVGLAGVTAVALYAQTNDRVLELSPLIGNHMPVGAFTLVLVLAAAWNPLAGRLSQRWAFSTGELAVVLGTMLIASWVPSSGFYRYFHHAIIMPWVDASQHAAWQAEGTLTHLPPRLFPLAHDPHDPAYEQVYGGFVRGLSEGDARLPLAATPFAAWWIIVKYWLPLIGSLALCLGALLWMVHRQWSKHEQLAYPIASVAHALIARSGPALASDVFHSRLFWAGFSPVFFLHFLNYGNAWFPTRLPRVPLTWQAWGEWRALFPVLASSGYQPIATGRLSFLIIGIAYFIASEISLSMGLSTAVLVFVGAQVFVFSGTTVSATDHSATLAGAYVAYFVILALVGRHYYWSVLKGAFRWSYGPSRDADGSVWAGRLFLLGGAGFVASLVLTMGLDWLVAVVFAATLVVYFLVFARVIAETGIPFCQPNFDAGIMIGNVFGLPAVGPAAFVVIVYLGIILNPDARESMTPYLANTLKLSERAGVALRPMLVLGATATALALIVGFFAQTYGIYDRGARTDEIAMEVPSRTLDRVTQELSSLRANGRSERASAAHGIAKLGLIGENVGHGRALGFLAFGAFGVWTLAMLRFRISWWPLHPVILLMWGTWTSTLTWASFLLGWLLKELVVRLAGGGAYQRMKPLFIGVITGEIVCVAVTMVVGYVYYALTGRIPKNPGIFPG